MKPTLKELYRLKELFTIQERIDDVAMIELEIKEYEVTE